MSPAKSPGMEPGPTLRARAGADADLRPGRLPPATSVPPATDPPFGSAGLATLVALGLVVAVALLFVGGTRPPEEGEASAPRFRPARERASAGALRTWQDRYRAEHPDLLVGSPDVVTLAPPSDRPPLRRLPRTGSVRADGLVWTPERLARSTAPNTSVGRPGVASPSYPGVEPAEGDGRIIPMVEVLSVPPGARVSIDGRFLGLTPFARARPRDMTGGEVEIRLAGFEMATGELREDDEGHLRLSVKLAPVPEPNRSR